MASILRIILSESSIRSYSLRRVHITVWCDTIISVYKYSEMCFQASGSLPAEPSEQEMEEFDKVLLSPVFDRLQDIIMDLATKDDSILHWSPLMIHAFSELFMPWRERNFEVKCTPGPNMYAIFKQKAREAGLNPDSETPRSWPKL